MFLSPCLQKGGLNFGEMELRGNSLHVGPHVQAVRLCVPRFPALPPTAAQKLGTLIPERGCDNADNKKENCFWDKISHSKCKAQWQSC